MKRKIVNFLCLATMVFLSSARSQAAMISLTYAAQGSKSNDKLVLKTHFNSDQIVRKTESYQYCVEAAGDGGQDGSWDCARFETRYHHTMSVPVNIEMSFTRHSDGRVFTYSKEVQGFGEVYGQPADQLRLASFFRVVSSDYPEGTIDADVALDGVYPNIGYGSVTVHDKSWNKDEFQLHPQE